MYFKIYKSQKPKSKVWVRVSRQVSKKAVVRNKIKRRLRQMADMYCNINPNYIISVLPGADQASYWDLMTDLSKTLKQQGII